MGLHVAFSRPATHNSIDIAVGFQLKQLRDRLGLDAVMMSGRLSITEHELQAIESGQHRASASLLIATGIAFRVPAAYFYEGLSRVTATQ